MLRNFKLGTRFGLAAGMVVLFLIIVCVFGLVGLMQLAEVTRDFYDHPFTVSSKLLHISKGIMGMHRSMKDVVLADSTAALEIAVSEVNAIEQEVFDHFDLIEERYLGDKKDIEAARSKFSAWKPIRDEVITLVRNNRTEEAAAITKGKEAQHVRELEEQLDDLLALTENKATNFMLELEPAKQQQMIILFILAGVTIVITVFLVYFTSRSITTPIKAMVDLTKQIADGDLTVYVSEDKYLDEIGILTRSFNSMVDNLREQVGEIIEGSKTLASSANEIRASAGQLSSAATETAVTVSETTTTTEEVKQTAEVTNEKAKYVSERSQSLTQIAEDGKAATDNTIKAMNHVREQVESIAESSVGLSEQTQAIGAIIATVDDLATQSSLLAVNASIEASRAGEEGKGFAVVAQEVNSLAEQSKQATAQVRAILTDFQKSTNAVVMSTEQGIKAVASGEKQAVEAGEAIMKLAESVTEASKAAMQIAISSQQQLLGMDQMSSAMDSIKQASTQNVSAAKQLEILAQNLEELSRKETQMVEQYKYKKERHNG